MSKAYTTRSSSVNTRGRGSSPRASGRGQPPRPNQRTSLPNCPQANPISNSRGRGRGRGQVIGPATSTRSRSFQSNTANSPGRAMYAGETPGTQPGCSRQQNPEGETSQDSTQRGEHVGGFTVFQPNDRRRQKINDMAQRETAAYEKYKQQKKLTSVNYVGTVGGDVAEETARRKQSHDNRFQKLKRQQRQEDTRTSMREAEQRDIDAKKREARRKAEQNELQGRTADPEDLRRRREAFLRRIENQGNE